LHNQRGPRKTARCHHGGDNKYCHFEKKHYGAIAALNDGLLVAILIERDALFSVAAECLDDTATPISAVMTRNLIT